MTLTLCISGDVKGKARPRFSRRSGRAYTPSATVQAEADVTRAVREQLPADFVPFGGAICLRARIGVRVPISWSKRKRADALAGRVLPTSTPDLDNIAKLLGDALNGVLWRDDAQIVDLHVTRRYVEQVETWLCVAEVS